MPWGRRSTSWRRDMNDKGRKGNENYLLLSRPAAIRGKGGHGGEEAKGVVG